MGGHGSEADATGTNNDGVHNDLFGLGSFASSVHCLCKCWLLDAEEVLLQGSNIVLCPESVFNCYIWVRCFCWPGLLTGL